MIPIYSTKNLGHVSEPCMKPSSHSSLVSYQRSYNRPFGLREPYAQNVYHKEPNAHPEDGPTILIPSIAAPLDTKNSANHTTPQSLIPGVEKM